MLTSLPAKEQVKRRTSPFIATATGTFALTVSGIALNVVSSVLLARLLGSTAYGAYTYAMAWVDLLSVPAIFGSEKLLIRNLAIYKVQSAWDWMNGLLRWANRTVIVSSLGLVLLSTIVSASLLMHLHWSVLGVTSAAFFLLPLLSLMDLRKATLQGLHHVITGQLPGRIIRPLVFIILLAGAHLLLHKSLNAYTAVGINAIAVIVALLSAVYLARKALPSAMRNAPATYQSRVWVRSAIPLMLISGLSMANKKIDVLLLGALWDAEAVGIYHAACRAAEFVMFPLVPMNIALAPTIATLYARDDMQGLQRVITQSSRVVLLVSIPIVATLIIFGNQFLWLFGAEFMRGYTAVMILSLGQLVNAASGLVGQVLIMTGHERAAAMRIGMSLALSVVLNAALIPRWGLEGAASATALTTITWNLLLVVYVYRKLGIDSTALGCISRWR